MKQKFYITSPIYYASGAPHIGHAFTTVYADVISRYKREAGFDVLFLTGMDEHGSKIAQKAQDAKKTPQEFVDELAEKYLDLWKKLQIKNDDFIRTTSERHKKGVKEFVEKLYQSGDIYSGDYEGLYCVGCENFILEKDLANGFCPDHLQKPEIIKEKNYFFNLKKYLPQIKEKIISKELEIFPESRKNESLNIIDMDISDFSITRERVKWGIPFPYDEKQTIYVWVEALMNYVSALDFPDSEKFNKFWPADAHIIGAEINKFHTIFWPALLISVNLPLPKKIFIHGLFTVNGQKMSKTLGNAINPIDLINKFGSDATRYLLLSQFSALEHGDIKESEFAVKYNADLANGVGNLFERIFSMFLKYGDNKKIKAEIFDLEIKKALDENFKNYDSYINDFKLFEALKEVFYFVRYLDKYINEKSPWVLHKENGSSAELDKILSDLVLAVEKIIELFEPFMPAKMEESKDFVDKLKSGLLNTENKLSLFPRI
ncbi:MAG: methionine--tRNA ligase [Patescibacteria group bacterium]